jgi:hypothetical protein
MKEKPTKKSDAVVADEKRLRGILIRHRLSLLSASSSRTFTRVGLWIEKWLYLLFQEAFKLILMLFIIAFLYCAMVNYFRGQWIIGLASVGGAVAVGWLSERANDLGGIKKAMVK